MPTSNPTPKREPAGKYAAPLVILLILLFAVIGGPMRSGQPIEIALWLGGALVVAILVCGIAAMNYLASRK